MRRIGNPIKNNEDVYINWVKNFSRLRDIVAVSVLVEVGKGGIDNFAKFL